MPVMRARFPVFFIASLYITNLFPDLAARLYILHRIFLEDQVAIYEKRTECNERSRDHCREKIPNMQVLDEDIYDERVEPEIGERHGEIGGHLPMHPLPRLVAEGPELLQEEAHEKRAQEREHRRLEVMDMRVFGEHIQDSEVNDRCRA